VLTLGMFFAAYRHRALTVQALAKAPILTTSPGFSIVRDHHSRRRADLGLHDQQYPTPFGSSPFLGSHYLEPTRPA